MSRKESLLHFYMNQVEPERIRLMADLQYTLNSQSPMLTTEFLSYFEELTSKVRHSQQIGAKGNVAYIQYSLLRTEVATGAMHYLAEASDMSWLLDRKPIQAIYDAQWAFDCLERMLDRLKKTLPDYQGMISMVELDRIRLQEVTLVHRYVIYFIRQCFHQLLDSQLISDMQVEPEFEVRVGEYLDTSECVYRLDQRERNLEDIGRELEEGDGLGGMYADYHDLDMEEMICSDLDFRYSRFNDIRLKSTDFERCVLVGTRWHNCDMRDTNFADSLLYGADFNGCSLERAIFRGISGEEGHPDGRIQGPGYSGINFENANLTGADFRGARLRGAIFRRANLTNVLWDGADLEDAIFEESVKEESPCDTLG